VSGEVSRRSARELGYDGLAQRLGARTPEGLIQQVSGLTRTEARSLVRVGEVLDGSSPWLAGVASAVSNGELSIAAADGIISGLGAPSANVAADDLADAAERLVSVASELTPERTAATARAIRDDLDAAGVVDREHALRERRFLRLIPEADGMTKIFGRLDPESAAIVVAAVDRATSPRRGGPRFVDPLEVARADRLIADARTTEQIALDALVDMVKIATNADEGTVFGSRSPEVHVIVQLAELEAQAGEPGVAGGAGVAHIEGQRASVSINTAERFICSSGLVPVLFDKDRPLDVGRAERLFTSRQRIALAARDGGCVFPGCDRPPSWCEAHHIDQWERDGGRTDVDDGVLLCRHHHMLLHNAGWNIERRGRVRVLIPPEALDREQTPRALQSRGSPVGSRRDARANPPRQ